jgi:hypothetical protein
MPIYTVGADRLEPLPLTAFGVEGIRERADLQRLSREQVEIISPDTLVIAEEFGQWEDAHRRIDLLGLDRDANLVVIELKRTEDGGHMDLQALRYAAMVSSMTFAQAVEAHAAYLVRIGRTDDARQQILDFLRWDLPDEDHFAQDVRIVLAAADFAKELTTTVLWLTEQKGLDVRCVRFKTVQTR